MKTPLGIAAPLLAGLLLLGASTARAQSDVTAARDQFTVGNTAAEEERWEDARAAFERSYALAPRPVTLFNLARAQMMTGHLVDALESYRRFLHDANEARYASFRASAETAVRELDARVPRLLLQVTELRPGDRVLLDGAEIPRASVGIPYPINPGAHVVTVVRDEAEVGRASVDAPEGQVTSLALSAAAAAPIPTVAEVSPDPAPVVPILTAQEEPAPPPGEDLLGPVLGTVIGVLAAAAIAIGVTVYVLDQPSPSPFQGSLGPGVITIP